MFKIFEEFFQNATGTEKARIDRFLVGWARYFYMRRVCPGKKPALEKHNSSQEHISLRRGAWSVDKADGSCSDMIWRWLGWAGGLGATLRGQGSVGSCYSSGGEKSDKGNRLKRANCV